VADDLGRKAVILIAVDRWCVHAPSMSHRVSTGQVALNKLTMPVVVMNGWNRLLVAFRAVPGKYQPAARKVGG
jgi:hypothetical protein